MYNFNLNNNEKLIQVFDNIWIGQGKNEKITTIVLTNQRLLFLDYDNNDSRENLRISGKLNYVRYKEVYYWIDLKDIKSIDNNSINLSNKKHIEFDNKELLTLIKKEIYYKESLYE